MASVLEGLPLPPPRMAMDVPPCPVCGTEGTAIREKVLRGDTAIDFWCCPPCGARWHERPAD